MDERLEKALEVANIMSTLATQKQILKEKYQNDLIFFYKGGQFTVNFERIAFCSSLINFNQSDFIMIDDNNIPILIDNIEEFKNNLINTYATASNRYFVEYEKLKQKRSVKDIIEL